MTFRSLIVCPSLSSSSRLVSPGAIPSTITVLVVGIFTSAIFGFPICTTNASNFVLTTSALLSATTMLPAWAPSVLMSSPQLVPALPTTRARERYRLARFFIKEVLLGVQLRPEQNRFMLQYVANRATKTLAKEFDCVALLCTSVLILILSEFPENPRT